MKQHEAKQYVDIVVEALREWNVIKFDAYGKLTEAQLENLADKVVEASEE